MGNREKLSIGIIVTTYNSPDYLRQVLRGYLRQTMFPEVVVVADDGSTGETAAVVEEIAAVAPFAVRHVWQEDQGFRAARIRNLAAKSCWADYLIFTDGDCVPHPRFVADHARLARDTWFVQGKRMLLDKEVSSDFSYPGWRRLLGLCLRGKASGWHHLLRVPGLALAKRGLRGVKTCNLALFRRHFFAVNGCNEEFVGWGREDAELVARLYKYGLRRRDPLFSALVYHLWHRENSREGLARNDELLESVSRGSGFRCANGITREFGEDLSLALEEN